MNAGAAQPSFEDEMRRVVGLCVGERCESCGSLPDDARDYCPHTAWMFKQKAVYCPHWTEPAGAWLEQLYLAVDGPGVMF